MAEYIAMWKNYVNFQDRTTVRGYWMAFLFNFLAGLVLGIIVSIIKPLFFLSGLYSLAILIPSLAIGVRRLHDTNRSGWLILLSLIPLVGTIILIVFFCQASVDENNLYGDIQV